VCVCVRLFICHIHTHTRIAAAQKVGAIEKKKKGKEKGSTRDTIGYKVSVCVSECV
jgi:hypothetical protein